MSSLIQQAAVMAEYYHKNQARKWTGQPYFQHPYAVAGLVQMFGGDENMVAAAYLHDVMEDCGVDYWQLAYRFNDDVAWLVHELTKPNDPANAGDRAKLIKCADIIDNCGSIVDVAPQIDAEAYLTGKARQLDTMYRTTLKPPLAATAVDLVRVQLERVRSN